MSDRLDFRNVRTYDRSFGNAVRRLLTTGPWLLIVWVAIRGSVTIGSIIGGVVVVTLLMVLFGQGGAGTTSRHTVHPWWVLRYVAHFVIELTRANVQVALAVVFPSRVEHRRAIIEVPLPRSSRLVGAILANAVSLTPGTSIIEVSNDPPSFHVHVLAMSDADEIRSSIAELHWRLVRAIGPDGAREAVERDAAELRQRVTDARRSSRSHVTPSGRHGSTARGGNDVVYRSGQDSEGES